jgi:chorismate-pyruvate lyase
MSRLGVRPLGRALATARGHGRHDILVRYADDIVVGFEHEADARRFWDDMRKRFEDRCGLLF